MPYRYEYKVESVDYCGIFEYGVFISDVKVDVGKVEELIAATETYKDIVEYLREEAQSEFDDHHEDEDQIDFDFAIMEIEFTEI